MSNTTFWSARVAFPSTTSTVTGSLAEDSVADGASKNGFWDNPEGNPKPPVSPYDTPFRRADPPPNPSPSGLLEYDQPIQYIVRKTGYYCVGEFEPYFHQ
jgi:hypothetical protein